MNLIKVAWTVISDDGPEAYVLEFTNGQLALTFGPMPKGSVEAFTVNRKKAVATIFDNAIRKLNDGQDPPHQDEQVPADGLSQF